MEQWLPVVGCDGFYEISDRGRLRRVSAKRKQTKLGDYIKAPSRMKSGYLQYVLCIERRITSRLAHRLMWEAFKGPIPEGLEINHLNGVKTDNRLENLELCTRSQNVLHRFHVLGKPGASQVGEKNNAAKLTAAGVEAIRTDVRPGWVIAEYFGVSQATVSLIRSGKRWSTVEVK